MQEAAYRKKSKKSKDEAASGWIRGQNQEEWLNEILKMKSIHLHFLLFFRLCFFYELNTACFSYLFKSRGDLLNLETYF